MIEYLNNMSSNEFLKYIRSVPSNIKKDLIIKNDLDKLSIEKFGFFFQSLNVEEVRLLTENPSLYAKVLNLSINSKGILQVLALYKKDILNELIKSKYAINHVDKFLSFIDKMSIMQLNELDVTDLNSLIEDYFYEGKMDIKSYLKYKFGSYDEFEDIFNLYYAKLKNGKLNLLSLLKIKTFNSFILYSKFGVLENLEETEYLTLSSGFVIPANIIKSVKDRHINKLMDILGYSSISLEVSLKLYYTFGLDNSLKILNNKFSYMTDSAILRVNDYTFKDQRREYRTKNQHEFYYHKIVDDVLSNIYDENNSMLRNLTIDKSIESEKKLRLELLDILKNTEKEEIYDKIKDKIIDLINKREETLKKEHLNTLTNFKNKKVDLNTLYDLLKGVDIEKVSSYDLDTIKNLNLFLLGNCKTNNDCLLRLILNNQAMGLNNSLSKLINDFKYIDSVAKKSKMSLKKVLDVIDILKINLYSLKPNEQDISLSILTRLENAKEYKIKNDIDVIKETCKLHVLRKSKVSSTIPSVSGKNYTVAPFDSPDLLVAGLDSKNCFRIAAQGEDFFRYCLTNKNAVIIYLESEDKTKYLCPVVRAGNMICANGIDPKPKDSDIEFLLKTLKTCFLEMIDKTKNTSEPIEVATLSNLNLDSHLDNLEQFKLQRPIPIDAKLYSDYNKDNIKHYILASYSYVTSKYYIPNITYYQNRQEDYEFDIDSTYDDEKISQIVNSICYSSIDYLKVSDKEKNKLRRFYKNIDVKYYKYIIGNKDWFLAIDENLNIKGNLLPYDDRARKDYSKAFAKIQEMVSLMEVQHVR